MNKSQCQCRTFPIRCSASLYLRACFRYQVTMMEGKAQMGLRDEGALCFLL